MTTRNLTTRYDYEVNKILLLGNFQELYISIKYVLGMATMEDKTMQGITKSYISPIKFKTRMFECSRRTLVSIEQRSRG